MTLTYKYLCLQLPPLPTNDRISYLFKYYWNTGVKSTFKLLIELPTYATNAAAKAYQLAASTMQAAEPSQDVKTVEK